MRYLSAALFLLLVGCNAPEPAPEPQVTAQVEPTYIPPEEDYADWYGYVLIPKPELLDAEIATLRPQRDGVDDFELRREAFEVLAHDKILPALDREIHLDPHTMRVQVLSGIKMVLVGGSEPITFPQSFLDDYIHHWAMIDGPGIPGPEPQ